MVINGLDCTDKKQISDSFMHSLSLLENRIMQILRDTENRIFVIISPIKLRPSLHFAQLAIVILYE